MWRVLTKPVVSYQIVVVIFRFLALGLLIAAMMELLFRMNGKVAILDPVLLAPIGILTSALLLAYNTAYQAEQDKARRAQEQKAAQDARLEHLLFLCQRLIKRTDEIKRFLISGDSKDLIFARQRAGLINEIWKTFYDKEYVDISLTAKKTISDLDSKLQNMTAACASPDMLRVKTREERTKRIRDWEVPEHVEKLADELRKTR